MFTAEEYLTGWLIYLMGAVCALVVWWFMTKKIPYKTPRNILRLCIAVILIMPYPVAYQNAHLAPAFFSSMLEGLFIKDQGFARAGVPILLSMSIAVALYLFIDFAWQLFWQKRQFDKKREQSHLEEHDQLIKDSDEQSA